MVYLVDQSGMYLVDQSGNRLVTDTTSSVGVFPLTLLLRLRLHAVLFWGTIMLAQLIPW